MDYTSESRTPLLVYVSELYYEQGMNQSDISNILGVSRPTISRLLDEAREKGVVEIIVHSPIEKNPELSSALRKELGLREATVIKGNYPHDKSLKRCAQSAASFVKSILENNQSIGISWGRAMQYFCESFPDSEYYNVNVIQMVGCLGSGNPHIDGLELALTLSRKINGTYSNIYAPVYADNEAVRDCLIESPQIATTLKKAAHADIILTGIGTFDDPNATLSRAGYFSSKELKSLIKQGAKAHILGRIYDSEGKEIFIPNKYVIAAKLKDTKNASWSIGISASAEKAEGTLATIRGGYINTLITDEDLARELLSII